MRRRQFITVLGGAATWPIVARGQQSSIPAIGFINGSSATAYAAYVQAFIRGLAETGHTVGENVAIEYRWAEGHYDRIPDMVDDLVHRRVAVLAPNTPAAHAAKRAVAAGTSSRKSPTCFAASSPNSDVTPVAFPPGRFKLATRPLATGSSPAVRKARRTARPRRAATAYHVRR
jgi:hypothetical protein